MARYVRLYNSPNPERPGSIVGFSRSIYQGAFDDFLKKWLENRGYTVTQESPEQQACRGSLGGSSNEGLATDIARILGIDVRGKSLFPESALTTKGYATAPGIPLPEQTVSSSHLLIEPPLKDEDLEPLGLCLSSLESLYDEGMRKHCFIDNRTVEPEEPTRQSQILYAWG